MEGVLYIGILLGFIALAAVAMLLLSYTQTKKFTVKNVNARPEGLNSAPKRICLISDLHFPMFFVNINDLVYSISKTESDAIMIAGDVCTNHKIGEKKMAEFLTKLSKATETKIYVVLGNHDYGNRKKYDAREMNRYKKAIEACGENIKVLDNEILTKKIAGTDSRLVIAGISDFRNTSDITAKNVCEEGLREAELNDTFIILTHNPDTITNIEDSLNESGRDCLMLCGHTHGGQFWLPFNIEFLILRKDKLPKKGYKYGLFDWNEKTKLFITCGLGESLLPIRFRTTPEVVFIDY